MKEVVSPKATELEGAEVLMMLLKIRAYQAILRGVTTEKREQLVVELLEMRDHIRAFREEGVQWDFR